MERRYFQAALLRSNMKDFQEGHGGRQKCDNTSSEQITLFLRERVEIHMFVKLLP